MNRSSRKRNIEEIEDENIGEIEKEESWTEYVIKCKESKIEKKPINQRNSVCMGDNRWH